MHTAFATLAERSRGAAAGVYEYFSLAARATRALFSRPFYGRDILIQLDRIGVASLPIMAFTGLVAGLVLALQSEDELERFGALNYMGNIVGASMVREIGPVMGSLAFAGRVASGIAAELGSMRVTEQIDALQSFGTDPIKKLVKPRLLAGIIMLPALTIIMDLIGILGGMLMALADEGVPADVFLRGARTAFGLGGVLAGFMPRDFVMGLLKPAVFGGAITLTGSYYGLHATGGADAVGRATTRAVVVSSMLIFGLDYFLTQLLMVLLYNQQI